MTANTRVVITETYPDPDTYELRDFVGLNGTVVGETWRGGWHSVIQPASWPEGVTIVVPSWALAPWERSGQWDDRFPRRLEAA